MVSQEKKRILAEAIIKIKLELRNNLLQQSEGNYSVIANIGTDLSKRRTLWPDEINVEHVEKIKFFACGFRGFLYEDSKREFLYKTNYNLSFEIQREWDTYNKVKNRISASQFPDNLNHLEENINLIMFKKESELIGLYSALFNKYFDDEGILIKRKINGKTIKEIVDNAGTPDSITEEHIESIAKIFKTLGELGILLQGDPEDFILDEDTKFWKIIDPDGWVIYEVGDEYVKSSSRQAFIGTFSREWGSDMDNPTSEYNININPSFRKSCVLLMDKVTKIAEKYFGAKFIRAINPDELRNLLDREAVLNTNNVFLNSFVRKEFDNSLKLDNEMGRCSLNVIITSKQLFKELLELRKVSDFNSIRDFYFGDLDFIEGNIYVVIYNSYNDALNEKSHHWAYNHTGITNKEISERVLRKLESEKADSLA